MGQSCKSSKSILMSLSTILVVLYLYLTELLLFIARGLMLSLTLLTLKCKYTGTKKDKTC